MRKQKNLGVIALVVLGTVLCLGGCGTKNIDVNSATAAQGKQTDKSSTNVNGISLTSKTYDIGNFKIKFPECNSDLNYQVYTPENGGGATHIAGTELIDSREKPFYIGAFSCARESGIATEKIEEDLSQLSSIFKSPKVGFNNLESENINGVEVLKSDGQIYDDGASYSDYGIIEYYVILDNATPTQQAVWYGIYTYGDGTSYEKMRNYLDAMANSFKETKK